jgi:hypothetical protein
MAERPELAQVFRDGFLTRRRLALAEAPHRGVVRGDLRSDIDLELAVDLLDGPLFYRLLITGGPLGHNLQGSELDVIETREVSPPWVVG